MLDTENPASANIFAASRQLDLILQLCKLVTLQRTAAQRQYTLRIFQPAFAALRWLNAESFGRSAEIDSAIDELQQSAALLAGLETGDPPAGGYPPKECPVCRTPPVLPSQYSPTPYCPKCLDLIRPSLLRLSSDSGFRTDGI